MKKPFLDGNILRHDDLEGAVTRAFLQGTGITNDSLKKKPMIGICNSWSELNPCNLGLKEVAEGVKRGILAAGGIPVEFPTISINEQVNNPTSLYLRNLMAMDVEEMIDKSPIDGVVLLNGCDKTVPAQLMGAISANKPCISISAGPRNTSLCNGKVMTIHEIWGKKEERQKGELTDKEWDEFISKIIPSKGTCNVMGTASTMALMAEALGLSLPGTAMAPATSARRIRIAEETGKIAVEMTLKGLTPDKIVTMKSLENAFRVICALGGSTNAVIHLEAIAGRLGLRFGLDRFNQLSETTPQLVAVSPSGSFLLEDFEEAGELPALCKQMAPLLHQEALTVTGKTIGEIIESVEERPSQVIRPLDNPIQSRGGLAILRGTLAPNGAIFKRSAVPKELWQHKGPALVFDGVEDMFRRIDDPDLPVEENSVLILRGMGPVGGPGMPESANIPTPKKLWDRGIRNMVRISDGRMSGTADGAVILHVAPEAAVGGPLALVQDGDIIEFDANAGILNLLVDEEELAKRKQQFKQPSAPARGYAKLYHEHVTQADEGADFDFLIAHNKK